MPGAWRGNRAKRPAGRGWTNGPSVRIGATMTAEPQPRKPLALMRVFRASSGQCPDAVFERGQLLDTNRAARVHAARRDADLGAEAEFAAIGELRRGVVQDDGAIDLRQEPRGGGLVRRDDRIGVVRAVGLDMGDRCSRGRPRRGRR